MGPDSPSESNPSKTTPFHTPTSRLLINHNLDLLVFGKRNRLSSLTPPTVFKAHPAESCKKGSKMKKSELGEAKRLAKAKLKSKQILSQINLEKPTQLPLAYPVIEKRPAKVDAQPKPSQLETIIPLEEKQVSSSPQGSEVKGLRVKDSEILKPLEQRKSEQGPTTQSPLEDRKQQNNQVVIAQKDSGLPPLLRFRGKQQGSSGPYLKQQDSESYKPKKGKKNQKKSYSLNRIFQRDYKSVRRPSGVVKKRDLRHWNMTLLGLFQMVLVNLIDLEKDNSLGLIQLFQLRLDLLSSKGFIFVWIDPKNTNFIYNLMSHWGYQVVDQIVWVHIKENVVVSEPGSNILNKSFSQCLVGYRNSTNSAFDYSSKVSNNLIFGQPGTPPKELYQIIELMMPEARRIELLALNAEPRPGWIKIIHQKQRIFRQNLLYITCNSCGSSCSMGRMFKCLDCKSLNLCQTCVFSSQNPDSHLLSHRLKAVTDVHTKFDSKCSRCQCSLENGCWQCSECFKVFVCGSCGAQGLHPEIGAHLQSHKFERIL